MGETSKPPSCLSPYSLLSPFLPKSGLAFQLAWMHPCLALISDLAGGGNRSPCFRSLVRRFWVCICGSKQRDGKVISSRSPYVLSREHRRFLAIRCQENGT